jgi:hypothetical protein
VADQDDDKPAASRLADYCYRASVEGGRSVAVGLELPDASGKPELMSDGGVWVTIRRPVTKIDTGDFGASRVRFREDDNIVTAFMLSHEAAEGLVIALLELLNTRDSGGPAGT